MNARKMMLLFLPISVAFIVGGKSGSLLGDHDFFWAGAIAWGTVIGIIDYNFSILAKLNFLGTIGRIVLIMTSAVITSTVGDHIILEKTIASQKIEHFDNKIDKLKASPIKHVITAGLDDNVKRLKKLVETKEARLVILNEEYRKECADYPGKRCKWYEDKAVPTANKSLLDTRETLNKENDRLEKEQQAGIDKRIADIEILDELKKSPDVILEMKLLYKEIFNETITTIMFFLFALMVICIETLPLLLKSGLTYEEIKQETLTREQAIEEALLKAQNAEAKAIQDKKTALEQLILRNNRI